MPRVVSGSISSCILVTVLLLFVSTAFPAGEFDRAARLAMLGEYGGALEEYSVFIYDHPDHELAPLAALAAGNLHLDVFQDPEAAATKYDLILADYRRSPLAPEAASQKGAALRAMGKWEPAAEALELALALATREGSTQSAQWINDVTSGAADCYYKLGDHQRVVDTYRKALDGSPPPEVTATALFRMAETYEAMNEPGHAARRYAEILETCPCASGELFARVLGKRGLIDEQLSFGWGPYEAYDGSYQRIRQRDFAGALERCRESEASTDNPALLECVEARRISLEISISGDFQDGVRRMTAYRERHPGGQLHDRTGRIVDFWSGIVDAEAAVAEDPENAGALTGLGELYYYAGTYGRAIETLVRAQSLDPDQTAAYELLGSAYFYSGNNEDAVRQFELLLEKGDPSEARSLSTAGTACMQMEEFDKAVRFFERYAELAPEDPTGHSNLGDALFRAGRLVAAAEACERAVELDPSRSSALFILGQVRQERNETESAIQAFERFLELVPSGNLADQARAALAEMK